ncbi:TPA: hypothetical protein ACH3X1_004621 [Trebouxia sp. C0004]
MAMAVNAAGCKRIFFQMGLTHTKVRNRLGFAKTTHIAQLRQELHRHRAVRKKARVVASAATTDTQPKPLTGNTQVTHTAEDQLMDLDALTSADEFRLAVNEWFGDLDAEDRLAGMASFPAYQDSTAVVKAPLNDLFGSALMPILTTEAVSTY